MINFSGTISDETVIYIQKKLMFMLLISAIFGSLVVGSIFIGIGFTTDPIAFIMTVPMALLIIIACICLIIFSFVPRRKIMEKMLPISITIDEDNEEITVKMAKENFAESLSSVSKILDKGGIYDIRISSPLQISSIVCQKNLLVEGSIEEFEKLFEGKIVRKN